MKVSIAWIFDHIDADWRKVNIDDLVIAFNKVTAEIEGIERISFDLGSYAAARIIGSKEDFFVVEVPEWKQTIELSVRRDGSSEHNEGIGFLVKKSGEKITWATCKDFNLDKDGLLPAFDMTYEDMVGAWRDTFESEDVLIDVDNKTLTHRPDMWGHRGFAREIAAFMNLPFKKKDVFLRSYEETEYSEKSKATDECPFVIENKATDACSRFSGLYFSSVEQKPSNLLIASRLLKVGCRPLNNLVDLTNYVLFDWSQPVHAYDAEKIEKKQIVIRMAKKNETLTLLDGSELPLQKDDLVIADAEKALGLAGIMGGLHDSILPETKAVFFESANFDAATIRRTAFQHGVRTESSMRFEKTLDPYQNTDAIRRFLKLAEETGLPIQPSGAIASLGKKAEETRIQIAHSFMEKRLGISLEESEVIKTLTTLEFHVDRQIEGDDVLYDIHVPSFRATKDVQIKEDILEEVIRFYGFENIPLELPVFKKQAMDLTPMLRVRKLKEFLVYSAKMYEQQNYSYYDEQFLKEIALQFDNCVEIKNPVSENNYRMATSLIPGLLKNVKENFLYDEKLSFFELGRTWTLEGVHVHEKRSLAGVFFDRRNTVDFYHCKNYVIDLLRICGLKKNIEWKKVTSTSVRWGTHYETAELWDGDTYIGMAGKLDKALLSRLGVLPESDAFFFELDAESLLNHQDIPVTFQSLQKYQESTFDVSCTIPLSLEVAAIEKQIKDLDQLIRNVSLIDFFEKKEWNDKRSVAFRVLLSNPEKTLEKEEIEGVRVKVIAAIEKLGGTLRE
jgi:phenylalanyl-tRNA synthetase beta chain